jgi:signal transduction histidine kinase/ligand-binding sensor domain-containing protein
MRFYLLGPVRYPTPGSNQCVYNCSVMKRRDAIGLVLFLACCLSTSALDPSLDINQYAHKSWTVREGFFKGFINSMAQTPDGYLWFGTEFGLVRFDGVRPVQWEPPAGEHLPDSYIQILLAGRDGRLWIGTTKGLASWKDGKLTHYPELAGQKVGALLEDREGTVWAGGYLGASGRLCAIQNGSAHCFGEDGSLGRAVISLYEDGQGNLWAAGPAGLWRWKPGPPRLYPMPDRMQDLIEGDRGALLTVMNGGIRRLVGGKVEAYPLPDSVGQFNARHLLRDRNGGLWIGTADRGLLHVHQGKADLFAQSDGLSGDFILTLFEDREGSIWVASSGGLDRFRDFNVPTISARQGLSNATVLSVLAARDGSIWLGTVDGLNRWSDGQITIYRKRRRNPGLTRPAGSGVREIANSGLPDDYVESLSQDDRGRIWVFTRGGTAWLENAHFIPVSGVPGGYAYSIASNSAGDLWISDKDHGLFHLHGKTMVEQIPWDQLGNKGYAVTLLADPARGGLWLGFVRGGVAFLKDGRVRAQYASTEGLGAGPVEGLQLDGDGTLWAATEGGLSRVKNGPVATLSSKNGLPCDSVHWAVEDDDHSFWLDMACGLVRLARADLDAWAADSNRTVRATVFDGFDGVMSHSPSFGFSPRVAKSADGKLWFLPFDGVSVIDPHHLSVNKLPPPVHIEQISADRKTYWSSSSDASSHLRLPPRVRDVWIDYTALSLVAPEKVRFRYKLEGQDPNWIEVANDRQAQYSNLAPGHYRFRVTACNNSGVWNEAGTFLDFSVAPAYYQTTWFRLSCLAAFALLLWAAYLLRVRQLAHQFNMRLEERVGERTRIARDLHDTLLQSFQALLPRLQAAIYKLPESPVEARKTLEVAVDQASEAITEGRDAVQGLRASTVEQNDLALAIRTVGEELASADHNQSSPEFNVVVEGTSRNLHPILRDEVYRLAAEALRNAFRHAAAQNVEVEIRYDERHFRLRVRDDGKGIGDEVLRAEEREGHYGLPGMKERARLVGGKLTIWSEVDNGTEIELVIPASRAYAQPTRRLWKFGKRSPQHVDVKETINRE